MSKLSKELIRQIIADGEFSTPNDIGEYLKDMFKDVIQEMLEKELALELGYEKGDSQNKNTDNRRNGYSKKTVKSQFGNIELDIPRDRNSEYNPKVIPKHTKNISGLEEKLFHYMQEVCQLGIYMIKLKIYMALKYQLNM